MLSCRLSSGAYKSTLVYTFTRKNIYESLLERGADVNKHIDRLIQSRVDLTRLKSKLKGGIHHFIGLLV